MKLQNAVIEHNLVRMQNQDITDDSRDIWFDVCVVTGYNIGVGSVDLEPLLLACLGFSDRQIVYGSWYDVIHYFNRLLSHCAPNCLYNERSHWRHAKTMPLMLPKTLEIGRPGMMKPYALPVKDNRIELKTKVHGDIAPREVKFSICFFLTDTDALNIQFDPNCLKFSANATRSNWYWLHAPEPFLISGIRSTDPRMTLIYSDESQSTLTASSVGPSDAVPTAALQNLATATTDGEVVRAMQQLANAAIGDDFVKTLNWQDVHLQTLGRHIQELIATSSDTLTKFFIVYTTLAEFARHPVVALSV